jgi:hypothetical protein
MSLRSWIQYFFQSNNVDTNVMRYAAARFIKDDDPYRQEVELGVKFNALLIYRPIKSVGYKYIRQDGKRMQLVLEMNDSLQSIVDGKYDILLKATANDIKSVGKEVWIRPLHEFNLSTSVYPWCVYPNLNDSKIALFKSAWKHIVNIFRAVGAPAKFQLCYNVSNYNGDNTPFSKFYPGSEYVDMVGVDVYNRCGLDVWHTKFVQFKDLFSSAYNQLTPFGKTIFIGETSTTDINGDKPQWIYNAWQSLRYIFPKVTIVNFFAENKEARWGLNTSDEKKQFKNGFWVYMA